MVATRTSHPRFKRPAEGPGIRLTEDDYEVLRHVYRHRLIESRSLYRLLPHRSEQVLSRRLKLMFRTNFLDRPINQNMKSRLKPGTDFYVYALAREGARAMREHFNADVPVARWTDKNAKLSVTSIEHHIETSRFLVELEAGAATTREARLVHLDELMPPEFAANRPAGLFNAIRADVSWHVPGRMEGTAPDAIVGLERGGKRQSLFIEIDRGTETIEPTNRQLRSPRFWRDTSFLRKMLIYGAAFRAKAQKTQLGLPVFRVLTVTTNPGRVALMQQAYERHLTQAERKVPPGMFLFTDWQSIRSGCDPLNVKYQNGAGREVGLLD